MSLDFGEELLALIQGSVDLSSLVKDPPTFFMATVKEFEAGKAVLNSGVQAHVLNSGIVFPGEQVLVVRTAEGNYFILRNFYGGATGKVELEGKALSLMLAVIQFKKQADSGDVSFAGIRSLNTRATYKVRRSEDDAFIYGVEMGKIVHRGAADADNLQFLFHHTMTDLPVFDLREFRVKTPEQEIISRGSIHFPKIVLKDPTDQREYELVGEPQVASFGGRSAIASVVRIVEHPYEGDDPDIDKPPDPEWPPDWVDVEDPVDLPDPDDTGVIGDGDPRNNPFDESQFSLEIWTIKTDGTDDGKIAEVSIPPLDFPDAGSWSPSIHMMPGVIRVKSNVWDFYNLSTFILDMGFQGEDGEIFCGSVIVGGPSDIDVSLKAPMAINGYTSFRIEDVQAGGIDPEHLVLTWSAAWFGSGHAAKFKTRPDVVLHYTGTALFRIVPVRGPWYF